MNITPIILCGGSGSRLWPASRTNTPKQFIRVLDEHTLFETTLLRLKSETGFTAPLTICNQNHQYLCQEQLQKNNIEPLHIIVEPEGRNTMPAITLAVLYLEQHYKVATQALVLPIDHMIDNPDHYYEIIRKVSPLANKSLVTFGITNPHPHIPVMATFN